MINGRLISGSLFLARRSSALPSFKHLGICGSARREAAYSSQPHLAQATDTTSEEAEAKLSEICGAFRFAARRNNARQALQQLHAFQREGGRSRLWMYNTLISMHARRRDPNAALEAAKQLRDANLRPDLYTYGALLNACAKAQHPPYDLPPEFARRAQALYEEMIAAGICPNQIVIHSLMDCQAKAGLVDEAFASFKLLHQHGLRPDTTSYNILVSACARAGLPFRAQEVVEKLMPAAGLQPDLVTWNTLLSAFARIRHIDGAYKTWQKMQRAGVVPDKTTQKILAEAFAANPGLAADLVAEAVGLREFLLEQPPEAENDTAAAIEPGAAATAAATREPSATAGANTHVNGIKHLLRIHRRTSTQLDEVGRQLSSDEAVEQPLWLDLHGLSQSAARVAILRRLDYLVNQNVDWEKLSINGGSSDLTSGISSRMSLTGGDPPPSKAHPQHVLGGREEPCQPSTAYRSSLTKSWTDPSAFSVSLGGRATVGDVAARAGTKLEEAEEALNALAADSLGTLQVSEEGDVLYVLPSNFKAIISGRSWLLRVQPFLKSIKAGAEYLVRVSFGTTLIASVVMVWAAIIAIMSSSSDRDDNRRRNNYGGGGYGYGNGYSRGSGMYFNLTDLLWYWDPYYYRSRRMRMSSGEEMGFLESVFSFVFGDGDPNLTYDEQRWKLVGRFIQHRGGVVTAEELAPYLDVPKTFGDPDSDTVDEAFVVPALVRFGGSPEVDSDGNLLYRFPSLQRTARAQAVPPPGERAALESTWKFSSASAGQRFAAAALGAANLVGVVVLGSLLRDPQMQYRLAHSGLAFVGGLFPLLQVYAGAFFAIPAIRWILNQQKNLAIQARNDARLRQFERLQQPDLKLRAKLLNAARSSQRTVIRDSDIVYRSDKALESQPQDLDGLDFDRRLRELESM
ncbi:hypothetical protein WJX72_002793 [[Myrmecia] bisecta]|uniref:PROP1-like PPR domain-containing protein n=1 Tax=[Myrmecia] bisecta TaxID=41462 RepID=A0AAW1PPZ3_9CHLO